MSIEMTAEYKGYSIKWNDWNKVFTISMDGVEVNRGVQNLADAEKWIDAKSKQKFKRVPVYYASAYKGIISGEATSAIDDKFVWFVSAKGDRTKVEAKALWLINDANTLIKEQTEEKEKQIANLAKEIKELSVGVKRLTISMMDA